MKVVIEFDLSNEDDKLEYEEYFLKRVGNSRAVDTALNRIRSLLKYSPDLSSDTAEVLEELRDEIVAAAQDYSQG